MAARAVFSPNDMPPDYVERSATSLLLRPSEFQHAIASGEVVDAGDGSGAGSPWDKLGDLWRS